MEQENVYIFLYDLSDKKLSESFYDYSDIIIKHWGFLRNLKKEKKLIFAGTSLDNFYEFAVIQTNSEEEIKSIIKSDPYVYNQLLNVSLYRFKTSLVTEEAVPEVLEEEFLDIESIYDDETKIYMGTITGRSTFINDMTEEEGKIMEIHFEHLKSRFDEKQLLLAGPILAEGQFGLTVFTANSLKEAEDFVKNDPVVDAEIMIPGVHPFRIFLLGEK
jgi:uncharacterized protein YciI